ncbi:MAG: zinc ribbon domain-containing protein [Nitrospirae bacterium]|jgi:putative FmdB family regulatory protein|nr:zinc ribbon domain-containing protein [Nitrospirota bacterium]
MPIYEYICDNCGVKSEVIQKISDAPLEACPKCSGKVRKAMSNTSFVLKGGGWYKDGYSSTSGGGASSSSPISSGSSSSGSSGNGSSKTETKTESANGSAAAAKASTVAA